MKKLLLCLFVLALFLSVSPTAFAYFTGVKFSPSIINTTANPYDSNANYYVNFWVNGEPAKVTGGNSKKGSGNNYDVNVKPIGFTCGASCDFSSGVVDIRRNDGSELQKGDQVSYILIKNVGQDQKQIYNFQGTFDGTNFNPTKTEQTDKTLVPANSAVNSLNTPAQPADGACPAPGGGPGVSTAIGCISASPIGLAQAVLQIAIGVAGGIAFLLMAFGAIRMIASAGNPDGIQQGRQILTSAIAGLLVIVLSVFILRFFGITILQLPGLSKSTPTTSTSGP